jgi:hypothetical protein
MKSFKRFIRFRKPDIRDVVEILIEDLEYKDSELDIIYEENTVIILHMIVIKYNPKYHLCSIAFASGMEALGASVIVHALHKNGISNIQFKENFFIVEDKTQSSGFICYYGEEADKVWTEVFRSNVIRELKHSFQNTVITKPEGGKTFH